MPSAPKDSTPALDHPSVRGRGTPQAHGLEQYTAGVGDNLWRFLGRLSRA
jgi:hypothetical protein